MEDGKMNEYLWVVKNLENFHLGYKTDIGAFTYINAKHGVFVEDYVQIGSHCSIYTHSTIDDKKGPVHMKKGCRIGTHSVIMPGVTIGAGSIVGACSYVNRDIPAGVLAYGIPVKVKQKISHVNDENFEVSQ